MTTIEDTDIESSRVGRLAPLSAKAVDRLKKPAFVGGVAGLQLNISKNGVRSWRLFYRLPGLDRRMAMTLGPYPTLGLADARKRAVTALAGAAKGEDPKQARAARAHQEALTVEAAVDDYLKYCERQNSAVTIREKYKAFRQHVRPFVGKRPVAHMKRRDWLALVEADTVTLAMRRALYMYIRHFLVWAMEREHIETHPLYGVRPPKAGMSRDRVLTDEEVRHFWRISGECGDLARLALLTAQRQQSLAHMQWRHLDLERGLWSVPAANMKSGKPHVVPLSASAIEILNDRKRLDGPYVFGIGSNGERPFNGFSNGMESLRKTVVREPNQQGKRLSVAYKVDRRKRALERRETQWRFHDLRRSAVTFAQRGGASLDAVKALTQHKTAGVIGIYARHAFTNEKRTVATLIEQEVLAILRGKTREEDSGMIEKVPQPNRWATKDPDQPSLFETF